MLGTLSIRLSVDAGILIRIGSIMSLEEVMTVNFAIKLVICLGALFKRT